MNGRLEPWSTAPMASMAALVQLTALREAGPFVPEGGVDDGIRRGCSAAEAFQVLQIASMRLCAGGFKRLCARIRSRHPQDLVARTDELFHDGGTDESGSAGNEYTHIYLPDLSKTGIDERLLSQLKRRHPPNR
jgi:hypothetical protein